MGCTCCTAIDVDNDDNHIQSKDYENTSIRESMFDECPEFPCFKLTRPK